MHSTENNKQFESIDEEQLPVAKHRLHDWTHFAGLYAAERTKSDPLAFIKQKTIFGDLHKNELFTSCYKEQIQKIYLDNSIKKHMKEILSDE